MLFVDNMTIEYECRVDTAIMQIQPFWFALAARFFHFSKYDPNLHLHGQGYICMPKVFYAVRRYPHG